MLAIAQLINEAWAYESNNDHDVALRLYKTAFNNILDINGQVNTATMSTLPGVSPFEVRSVADYLSYRTCHIHFMLDHPREAITQFRKYIDTFKQHTKSPDYAFEHSAWLSQQYLMFADLFHQAVINGTKASKTQHPGHYYYESAMQMIERRKNITEYTNDEIRSNQMPVTNELLMMITTNNFSAYLRQCGWTCIDPETGPPVEPGASQLQQRKTIVEPINYSVRNLEEIIMRALYKAIEYSDQWKRSRMQTYISVLIADEYLSNQDLSKAFALYNRSLALYDRECWSPLVDHIKERLATIGLGSKFPESALSAR